MKVGIVEWTPVILNHLDLEHILGIARPFNSNIVDSALNYVKKFTSEKRAQSAIDKAKKYNNEYEYKIYYVENIDDLRRR